MYLNFDVKRLKKYSFSYRTSHIMQIYDISSLNPQDIIIGTIDVDNVLWHL